MFNFKVNITFRDIIMNYLQLEDLEFGGTRLKDFFNTTFDGTQNITQLLNQSQEIFQM